LSRKIEVLNEQIQTEDKIEIKTNNYQKLNETASFCLNNIYDQAVKKVKTIKKKSNNKKILFIIKIIKNVCII